MIMAVLGGGEVKARVKNNEWTKIEMPGGRQENVCYVSEYDYGTARLHA